VKWTVVAEPGEQPAPARLRALDASGFSAIPQPWAFVTWQPADRPPLLLASVSEYLPDASDGWTWFVDDVRAVAQGKVAFDVAVEPARRIGALAAQMHVALAGTDAPAQADSAQVREWTAAARRVLDEALAVVDADDGRRLRHRAGHIEADIERLSDAAPTPVISGHGDFHVGQVLRYPGDNGWAYAFNDFDGNPVLSPRLRLQPQPAARDVAAMLASLEHVGRVVVRRSQDIDAAVVDDWIAAAQNEFLTAYRGQLAALGRAELFDEWLLPGMRAEQECREFLYAVRHLPHWRYVPDAALAALYPDDRP
jgi:maltokinase